MIDIDKINEITFRKIHTELLPVKRLNEEFNLIYVKEGYKKYLTELMQLTETGKSPNDFIENAAIVYRD